MSERKKLIDRHAVVEKEMKGLLDASTAAGRLEMNDDEARKFDELVCQRGSLRALIATEDRKVDRELGQKLGTFDSFAEIPFRGNPAADTPGDAATRSRHEGHPGVNPALRTGGHSYRDMFGEDGSNDGWDCCEQFMRVVQSRQSHPSLRSAIGGVGSEGGFLVPSGYVQQLLDASLENEIVRPRCKIEPMSTDTLTIAGFDSSDNSSSAIFGGLTASWLGETGEATPVDPKVRAIKLTAKKLAIYCRASNEVVADGAGFEGLLTNAMRLAFGWHVDDVALNGSGAGRPLGVRNDPAKIEVAKEVGQPADTIEYSNLTKMFARLHPACVGSSVWVANTTCIPQLMELSIGVGTAGQVVPVMSESNGAFSLLTRPILFTEKLPVVGDADDILLVDFSQYSLGMRKEFSLETSQAVSWETDQTDFRLIGRLDGMGRWSGPFTPKNGDTLSWAVSLAERA